MPPATHPVDLADGRMLAPGETADIDTRRPAPPCLIDAGLLIPISPRAAARAGPDPAQGHPPGKED